MSKNTNLSFLTDYITADITNGRIGINNASPTVAFDVVGVAKFSSTVTAGGATAIADALLPIQINAVATTGQAYFASNNNGGYGLLMGYDNANGYARIRNVSNTALTFETNNTEKVRITSAGNVGIGTSSPSNKLDINQTGSAINSVSGVGLKIYADAGNDVSLALSQTARGTFFLENLSAAAVPSDIRFRADVASNFIFMSNSTERMRITSGGAVLVGTTSSYNLGLTLLNSGQIGTTTSGGINIQFWNQATSGDNGFASFYTEGGGGALRGSIDYNRAAGLVRYNVTSDYRLKTDLKDFNGGDILNQVKVYDYKLKETGNRVYGVMAHELQEVISYAVGGVKDGEKMQSVDYSIIVPVLIKAVQELKAEIETLKNK
jgi:hypothetical protein